jgi:hypothetical protein
MAENLDSLRDIGDLGQDHFRGLCTGNGLSAVPANPDKHGWDFFVEFPPNLDPTIPLDRQNTLFKFLVQVKSTETDSTSILFKLSALKRLVDADLPAVIAHMQYDKDAPLPARIRLLHIGPTHIENVLKRVREEQKRGRTDIHNIQVSISLDGSTEINMDGSSLKDALRSFVPGSPASYASEKEAFRSKCGFNENSFHAVFSLANGSGEDELVDLMLGKIPQLAVSELVVSKKRFDIELDIDVERFAHGQLSVEVKPHSTGRIFVIDPDSVRRPSLEVSFYTPGIPTLDPESRRVRASNDFLELTLNFGTGRCDFNFRIDPDSKYPLGRLSSAISFGHALAKEGISLEIQIDTLGTIPLALNAPSASDNRWSLLSEFSEILSIALFRYRREIQLDISLSELSRYLDENVEMFGLLTRPGLRLGFAVASNGPQFDPNDVLVIAPVCIRFGTLVYVAVVKIHATIDSKQENSVKILGSAPSILEDGILDEKTFDVSALNERANRLAQPLEVAGIAVIVPFLHKTDS